MSSSFKTTDRTAAKDHDGRRVESEVGLLALAGQLVAVAAAALPFLGALIRVIAFDAGAGGTTPVSSALAATLPELAATGGLAAIFAVLPALFIPIFRNRWTPDRWTVTRRVGLRRTVPIVGVVAAIVLAIFAPAFPVSHISMVAGIVTGMWFGHLGIRGRLYFRAAWPALLLSMLFSAAAIGLGGGVPTVSVDRVTFTPDSALANEDYVILGDLNGLTHLKPCDGERDGTIRVARENIIRFEGYRTRSPLGPSLASMIVNDTRPILGLRDLCRTRR